MERLNNFGNVTFGVRGGQETGEAFEDVNAFFAELVVKQAGKREVRRDAEVEDARESFDTARDLIFVEESVKLSDQLGGVSGEVLLQRWAFRLEMPEDRLYRGESKRMTDEGAREERNAHGRIGIVAKLPGAAV